MDEIPQIMRPEFVGADPFRGKRPTANIQTRHQRELAYLSTRPVLIEPILRLFYKGVYHAYWFMFTRLERGGITLGDYLRELT